MTFCSSDKIDITSRASAVLESTAGDRQTCFNQLIFTIHEFMKSAKLQWVVIADQHNALHKSSRLQGLTVHDAPFSVLKLWASQRCDINTFRHRRQRKLSKKLRYVTPHDVGVRKFDEMEFRIWYDYSGLCVDDDIIREVRFWTGDVPLELDHFSNIVHSSPGKTGCEMLHCLASSSLSSCDDGTI